MKLLVTPILTTTYIDNLPYEGIGSVEDRVLEQVRKYIQHQIDHYGPDHQMSLQEVKGLFE